MNAASYAVLSRIAEVHYVGPVNPPAIFTEKALSKILRTAKLHGTFSFYSRKRLRKVADEVHARSLAHANLDFFHGFTPWILTKTPRRYIAWSDCTFHDYVRIFHDRDRFSKDDLERIERAETAWLKRADRILFSTRWAAERAVRRYGLDATRVETTGMFGELDAPERDTYAGAREFAFVATNFSAKGGYIVLSAFRELRRRYADASLTVIGERPADVSDQPGVEFVGFLRKEVSHQYERYRQILARVRALVHPTKSDICPLIVVEAGYFGCPAISSRMFAISELIDDMRTGVLLDDPSSIAAVEDAMRWMLENEDQYRQMRRAAWAKAHGRHSKAQYDQRLSEVIHELISCGSYGSAR